MNIKKIAELHYTWVESFGWHNKTTLECLALIASEVGEAINECRGVEPTPKLASELADIILRTVDLAESLNINIETAIQDKMSKNMSLTKSDLKLK